MMFKGKTANGGRGRDLAMDRVPDSVVDEALKSFRQSVHAWSDSACSLSRTAFAAAPRRRVWRLAAGWALGCALGAGVVSGGVYQVHHRQQMARLAAEREAERQKQLVQEREKETERLLAEVDSDISREVPSAMEPLAQMMTQDESQ